MSQYPGYPWPYGQYHGHPAPPPPPPPPPTHSPYGYQTPTAYPAPPFPPPPTYSAPGAFPPPAAHQTAAQGSFNYNASNIPGLGMGANSTGHAFPGAPAPSPWGQPMPASYTPTIPNPHSTQQSVTTSAKPPQPVVAAAQVAVSIEMEEGELSEGQFEDLYDDTQKSPPPANPPNQTAKQLSVAQPSTDPSTVHSQPTSASDTPEGGFYGNDEEEGEVGSKGDGATSRDRSASYSPFLSPREDSHEEPPLETEGPGPLNTSKPQSNNTPQTDPHVQNVGLPDLQGQSTTVTDANGNSKRPANYLETFKTVPEVKKEAQKAILRLWALGVKYQTYLDEGFDENVIRSLFGDLHLELPKPIVEKTKAEAKTAPSPGAGSDSPITGQTQGTQSESQEVATEKSKGEERKDRIARLLAAKAAKGPAVLPPKPAVLPTNPAPAEVPKPVPPTGPKAKTRGEKERILQEKIAALQKAREAQASATGKTGSQTPINSATTTSAPQPPSGPSSMTLNLAGLKPGALPTQTSSLPTPPIPGLLTSSNIQLNTASQRKRPVAADFVDYPSATGSTKRPFGQLRQEASLIIDISDVSDDEEMDMDMGSPIDEPSSIQSRDGLTSTRGPLIRDFPPLTNTLPQRQLSTPTTPSHTPPTGPAMGGKRHTELTIKEREIQEMRRMIAQAEAKRKAKLLPAGSQAQTQVGRTPEPKNTGVSVLSSPAQSDRPTPQATPEATSIHKASQLENLNTSQKTGPRGRLAVLEEKRKRLEQLRAEEALLQAEIEKEMMAAQLEQANTPSDQSTPQDSGQNSGDDSTEVRSTQAVASTNAEGLSTAGTFLAPDNKQVDGATSAGEIRTSGEPSQTGIPLEQPVGPQPVERQQTLGSDAPSSSGSQCPSSSDSEEAQNAMSVDGGEPDSRQSADISLPNNDPDIQVNDETAAAANLEADLPSTDQDVDETTPMELDSEAPSPTTAESILSGVVDSDVNDADHLPISLPDQISSTTQSREAVQEAEAEATPEVPRKSSEKPDGAFKPYESPLRIFRAYRFHPDFDKTVPGGVKSLTYSGRVDTQKPLCPYELNNSQCPENCEFQHFKTIKALDDQILVELGKSDFTGEQRARFNQGLRELLQVYKAQKVRDFDVIARGIIKFRSEFLGDKSKVLSLDGVSI